MVVAATHRAVTAASDRESAMSRCRIAMRQFVVRADAAQLAIKP